MQLLFKSNYAAKLLGKRCFHSVFPLQRKAAVSKFSRNTRKQQLPAFVKQKIKAQRHLEKSKKANVRLNYAGLKASRLKKSLELFSDASETLEVASLASSEGVFHRFGDFVPEYLSQRVADCITKAFPQFEEPTVCQKLSIPTFTENLSAPLVIAAQTGTGKTLAYAASLLEALERLPDPASGLPRALVMVPTRELSYQVTDVLRKLASPLGLSVVPLTGDIAKRKLRRVFAEKRVDICVATAGMVHWMLSRETTISLRGVQQVIIDEADLFLDKDFNDDILPIVQAFERMNARYGIHTRFCFITATLPLTAKRNLDKLFGIEKVQQAVVPHTHRVLPNLHVQFVRVSSGQSKQQALVTVLAKEAETPQKIIVFCNTQRTCALLAALLEKKQIGRTLTLFRKQRRRIYIFDHQSSKHRMADDARLLDLQNRSKTALLLKQFLGDAPMTGDGPLILITTDLGARGLDAKHVSHVINYDFPNNSIDFLHRVGRTARAEQKGRATTIVTKSQSKHIRTIRDVLKSK